MKFLKVPKNEAEKIRLELVEKKIFASEYEVFSEGDFVFFPVNDSYLDFELAEMDAEKRKESPDSLKEALSKILTNDELEQLKTAFDIVGDIAILEIPSSLDGKEKEIGHALLDVHSNVKAVFRKLSPMEGKFRVRKLKHLAGENRTETVYREHGCSFRLDVSKVYFSVRFSHERGRIADLVKENEKILVMFAGVGPFAIVIAKKHPGARITAIELNPDAVHYMRENAGLNKTNIEVIEGDANNITEKDFDRIIMPLPKSAHEFLPAAVNALKKGGTIHFYSIVSIENPDQDAMKKVNEAVPGKMKLISWRVVKPYSVDLVQVVLDLEKNQ